MRLLTGTWNIEAVIGGYSAVHIGASVCLKYYVAR